MWVDRACGVSKRMRVDGRSTGRSIGRARSIGRVGVSTGPTRRGRAPSRHRPRHPVTVTAPFPPPSRSPPSTKSTDEKKMQSETREQSPQEALCRVRRATPRRRREAHRNCSYFQYDAADSTSTRKAFFASRATVAPSPS